MEKIVDFSPLRRYHAIVCNSRYADDLLISGGGVPQIQSLDRVRKNVVIGHHRTSVSLETQVWESLDDVCLREDMSLDQVCTAVNERRLSSSMSSSLRMFLLIYYRYLAEFLNKRNTSKAGRGFGQKPQMPFPSIFNVALDRLAAEQLRHARK